jgi:hypothetical protein
VSKNSLGTKVKFICLKCIVGTGLAIYTIATSIRYRNMNNIAPKRRLTLTYPSPYVCRARLGGAFLQGDIRDV